MKWLLITSDKDSGIKLRKIVNKNYIDCEKYELDFDSLDVNTLFKNIYEVSNCVIIADPDFSSNILDLIIGFCIGKNIDVYSNLNLESTYNIQNFYDFESVESIFSFLEENKNQIVKATEKKDAFSFLYKKGFPITVDNFITNMINNNCEICEYYIKAGIDINSCDKDGTPLLNIACRSENIDMVKWLLNKGSCIDSVSEDRGYTPLMDAVWKGNLEIAKYLIKQGACVNKINKEGQSMIILAVGANKIELCKLLAENGADVDFKDDMGMSAFGYASLFKKDNILEILEKYHKE